MKKGLSKTFFNTVLYIGIAMLLLVISLGGVVNVIVEKEGLEAMRKSNEVLLKEVGYHVSYMHDVNLALCRMEFSDSDVQGLLTFGGSTDIFSHNTIINRIKKSIIVNGMVDSVMLYNGRKGEYYCTDPFLSRYDDEMREILKNSRGEQTVFIVPRALNVPDQRRVLSYVMVSRFPENQAIETAVVVNVSASWMLSNLATDEAAGSELLLVDRQGAVVLDTKGTTKEYSLDEDLVSHIADGAEKSFIQEVDGEKRVVSYRAVTGTDWYLVNSQPYKMLYSMVDTIRTKMLLAVFLSLAAAFVVTVLVARIITRPLTNLTAMIQASYRGGSEKAEKDNHSFREVDYLLDVFENQQKAITQFENYREGTENALHNQYLKNTLLENGIGIFPTGSQNGKFQKLFTENETVCMVLLTISNFRNLPEDDVTERSLIRFAVCNIAGEVMERYGRVEVLPMSRGEVVLLLGRETPDEELCRELLNEVAENIETILHIAVSAFVEEQAYTQTGLAAGYKHLCAMSRYTLIYGVRCILLAKEINLQGKKALQYPQEMETCLLAALNEGNDKAAEGALHDFLQYLGEGSVESYLASVHKLILAMQTYVGKLNQHRLIKIQVDFDGALCRLKAAETGESVYQSLLGITQAVMAQMPTSATQKNTALVNGVKQYIQDHYSSKELCGKWLATEFGLSTAYLGMLFKDAESCGIQEYINRIRLEHAGEMVLNTELLISEIMDLCGFETSSFYRLYKAYYGVSPKEQRMLNRLTENEKGKEHKE